MARRPKIMLQTGVSWLDVYGCDWLTWVVAIRYFLVGDGETCAVSDSEGVTHCHTWIAFLCRTRRPHATARRSERTGFPLGKRYRCARRANLSRGFPASARRAVPRSAAELPWMLLCMDAAHRVPCPAKPRGGTYSGLGGVRGEFRMRGASIGGTCREGGARAVVGQWRGGFVPGTGARPRGEEAFPGSGPATIRSVGGG